MLAQCRIPEVCAAATHDVVRAVRLQHVSVELGLGERHVAADVARQQCLWVRELVFLQLLFAIETLAALAVNNSNSRPNNASLEPCVRVSNTLQLLVLATWFMHDIYTEYSTLNHTQSHRHDLFYLMHLPARLELCIHHFP